MYIRCEIAIVRFMHHKVKNVLSQCVNVVSQGENVAKEELFP